MAGFEKHSGKVAVYNEDDVDTDRIIPARFLSMVTRGGYGELLFTDVRGEGFPLDHPNASNASILIVGSNFGCGSSREHAVWAIQQAGFRAVVARKDREKQGFSDIFRQNAANCGLLLIELPPEAHTKFAELAPGFVVTIDLENQTLSIGNQVTKFEIAPALKAQHLEGLDLVGTTLRHEAEITKFEAKSGPFVPGS